ncbi:MAG: hypothetical protein GDA48_06885 [Hormoscilla sp. GM102CHS1]|nr:hypothetical protein [Hormoscilla sp. GM102CHS1]
MMKNLLGIHALVWAGSWNEADREKEIENTAACGYDLIEIPLLEPGTVDVAATVKLLEKYQIEAVTSLGLSRETDISSVRGRAGNHFPTLPFGTGLATFTASGYWVIGPCPG